MIFFAYLAVGLLAGLLSGLLGIGGGVVIVPALTEIFSWQGLPESRVMHSAIATSLALMIFTTASAAYWHYRLGQLRLELFFRFLPGMSIGVIWGSIIAHQLSSLDLEMLFSFLMLFIAYRLWFKKENDAPKPDWLSTSLMSFLIGGVAGLLGVGGGVLSVPYLLRYKISTAKAVALGAWLSFTAAVIGTLTWWLLSKPILATHSLSSWGYINWTAASVAGVAGALIAPLATRFAKSLSVQHLRRILAVVLVLLFFDKFTHWVRVVVQ